MYTRIYLILVGIRLYCALSPSYIHPDENFQGPEIVAGDIFNYVHHRTWEFASTEPARSVFPLWLIYGAPLALLQLLWSSSFPANPAPPPRYVFDALRTLMFLASFILEDWAIHELVPSPRRRLAAVLLVASSYVTWTYQTHTFSNAIETIVVLWCLVLVQRILGTKERTSAMASSMLGVLIVLGTFNRVTFPAFLFLPCLFLIPHFFRKPMSFLVFCLAITTTLLLAILTDTIYYNPTTPALTAALDFPVLTPLNALRYNLSATNLAKHGLHPRYTHLLVNLPQLLGPALILLLSPLCTQPLAIIHRLRTLPSRHENNLLLASVLPALLALSAAPHQEPRFLLPCVPLLLAAARPPHLSGFDVTPDVGQITRTRRFTYAWIVFNLALGALFGVLHQGGVVPAQLWLGEHKARWVSAEHGVEVLWWRTYSPPAWLLDAENAAAVAAARGATLTTVDLMGADAPAVQTRLGSALATGCEAVRVPRDAWAEALLVAPRTQLPVVATWCGSLRVKSLAAETPLGGGEMRARPHELRDLSSPRAAPEWICNEIFLAPRHLGLDDMDVVVTTALGEGAGAVPGRWWKWLRIPWTLWRMRGLSVWSLRRRCV